MITVACVWTGGKYKVDYVYRLRSMVKRHLPFPHRFVCLTDQPMPICDKGITWNYIARHNLTNWWAKLLLFNPVVRNGMFNPTLYLDLDTVLLDDITPLIEVSAPFGICANFTKARGNVNYPCRYGSCVMTFGQNWGREVWEKYVKRPEIIQECGRYGDQLAIEKLVPEATILQDVLPAGFFLHYKDIQSSPHPDNRVVVFGGRTTPENCGVDWVRENWR